MNYKQAYPREFGSFAHAKRRCNATTDNRFKYYGARGIEFKFFNFRDFISHIGPKPSDAHSLDRIDPKGHYEPGNVKWSTQPEQQRNRTNTLLFTFRGRTLCLKDWATEVGMSRQVLAGRHKRKWCVPCMLTIRPGAGRCES